MLQASISENLIILLNNTTHNILQWEYFVSLSIFIKLLDFSSK